MRLMRTDEPGRFNIMTENKIIGYAEAGEIFRFNKNGFRIFVDRFEHSTEILVKFKAKRKQR